MSEKEIVSEYKIVIGDILEKLNDYKEFFDLIIADPPFGINFNKSSHEYGSDGFTLYEDNFTSGEYEEFSYKWISKCYEALKPTGTMYIVSGWTNIGEILNAIKKTPFIIQNHIIWYFEWGVYTKRKFMTSHYHIPFLVKDEKNYIFKPYTINEASKRKKMPYEKDVWYWQDYNRGNDPNHIKGHPCQLPLQLMEKMIKISSNPRDWVGDVFSGSGGTLRACRELGRNCISFEMNPAYLDVMREKAKLDQKIAFRPQEKGVQKGLSSFLK